MALPKDAPLATFRARTGKGFGTYDEVWDDTAR
jgi:hypothetical protein